MARGERGARRARVRSRGSGAARAAAVALTALAALAAPALARRGPGSLGVLAAENCTWGPDEAGGVQIQLSAARGSQLFSAAPKREAVPRTPAELAADFVKQRPQKRKNVAFTAWPLTGGEGASPGSPVYIVGALAAAEVGPGAGASMRLHLVLSGSQAQASRGQGPSTGVPAGGLPARHCSVFLDKTKRKKRRRGQPNPTRVAPIGIQGPICVTNTTITQRCDPPNMPNWPAQPRPDLGWTFF